MRILVAEASEDDFFFIGFAVAVGIAEKFDIGTVLNIDAVLVGKNAKRNRQTFGKDTRLMRAARERMIENDNPIFRNAGVERFGGFGILIGIDWIFERCHGPHAALLIE